MNSRSRALAMAAIALTAAGCAFVPKTNHYLEETRGLYRDARADTQLARLAPGEVTRADDSIRLAQAAWMHPG